MMRYTKSVGFVAKMLNYAQRFGIFVDIERYAVAREVYFFKSLRYSHNGYCASQSHVVQRLHGSAELSFSAIDNYQLGQSFIKRV